MATLRTPRPRSELRDAKAVLARANDLEQRARLVDDGSELIVEAVLLCAGKVQEIAVPESAHCDAVRRVLSESDIGSRDALRRMRGVLRAAAQIDGLTEEGALDPSESAEPSSPHELPED